MKNTEKIKLLTSGLRECVQVLLCDEEPTEQSNARAIQAIDGAETILAMVEDDGGFAEPDVLRELKSALFYIETYGGEVTANFSAGGNMERVKAVVRSAEGETEPEQLATLPEITPAMRAAGAIAAKFGLLSRLSISESVKAVQGIADIIAKTHNAREASKNAR